MGKVGFLQEEAGSNSSMRLMCFVSLIASIVFASISLQSGSVESGELYIIFGFLVAAFAPKAVQKFAENVK